MIVKTINMTPNCMWVGNVTDAVIISICAT